MLDGEAFRPLGAVYALREQFRLADGSLRHIVLARSENAKKASDEHAAFGQAAEAMGQDAARFDQGEGVPRPAGRPSQRQRRQRRRLSR